MILVSAAIIRNTAGEILICQRGAGGSCAFLWEFPGGKQEAGETAADCLVRECREELGIEIDIVALLEQTSYTYPDNKIGLSFFAAHLKTPCKRERNMLPCILYTVSHAHVRETALRPSPGRGGKIGRICRFCLLFPAAAGIVCIEPPAAV